jgi:hypothetical protein
LKLVGQELRHTDSHWSKSRECELESRQSKLESR